MEKNQLETLKDTISHLKSKLAQRMAKQLQLTKTSRALDKLAEYEVKCEECRHHLNELKSHLMKLREAEPTTDQDVGIQKRSLSIALKHLKKKHKLISEVYYISTYMAIGTGVGLFFGLVINDNLALTLPLGVFIGLAVGSSLNAVAKKNGLTI